MARAQSGRVRWYGQAGPGKGRGGVADNAGIHAEFTIHAGFMVHESLLHAGILVES